MVAPAAIEVIRPKLGSPTPGVRIVALWHARARGESGIQLAADVARCFEDDDAAVAWHAMGAFMAIGRGARDAVPILVAQLERGRPEMLVSRALSALEVIGPAARAALPVLQRLHQRRDPWRTTTPLSVMIVIAGDDPDVQAAIRAEIAAHPHAAAGYLKHVPADVIDELVTNTLARLVGDPSKEDAALLGELAQYRRERVAEAARSLLGVSCGTVVRHAIAVLNDPSSDDETLARISEVARVHPDDGARTYALEVLGQAGPRAAALVRPLAHATLGSLSETIPCRGEHRAVGYRFAGAANALAKACPTDHEGGRKLLVWLERLPARLADEADPNWYVIRDVLRAAVMLAPDDPRIADVMVALARTARRFIDTDESGVLDFDRQLRGLADDFIGLLRRLEDAGVPGFDPNDDPSEQDQDEPELPDFPPEAPPPSPPVLVPASGTMLHEVKSRRAVGATLAGVELASEPAVLVDAIDGFVRRARRENRVVSPAETHALAMLWGDAVCRAAKWKWRTLAVDGEQLVAIASADEAYACALVSFLARQIVDDESTIVLTFNMIRAGNLPKRCEGQVTLVA